MDSYILLGLNRKKVKIMNIETREGIIKVEIKSNKMKARCPYCNNFTKSVHDVLKPIKSKYLDSCEKAVDLVITKRRFHCYNCKKLLQNH